jgi:GT2 family glycosyltransferase
LKNTQQTTWPKVTVVIVNLNGEKFIHRCLSSVLKQTVTPSEIILVDNGSSDTSLDIVRHFPSVRLLAQTEDLGCARGNNLVINVVDVESDWIALLNPDAFPDPHWLEELLSAARDYPGFEVFGSKLVDAADPVMLDGVGDVYHISGLVWRKGHRNAVDASTIKIKEIFSPCGAASLYRKDVFAEAKGFDEDYFCYLEDVDLGFRLRLLGYHCLYVPQSVAYHIGSATTGKHSDFSIYHGHRNLVWTYIKNMPGALFWLLLPLHITLNLASIVWFSLQRQGKVILKAKWDALCGIPHMWRKRREIQKKRKASVWEIWRALNKSILPRLYERF